MGTRQTTLTHFLITPALTGPKLTFRNPPEPPNFTQRDAPRAQNPNPQFRFPPSPRRRSAGGAGGGSSIIRRSKSNPSPTQRLSAATACSSLTSQTLATIRRLRGSYKRKPGDKPFTQEWAEHKASEKALEDRLDHAAPLQKTVGTDRWPSASTHSLCSLRSLWFKQLLPFLPACSR